MVTDEERREVARRLKSILGLDYCKDPRYAVELASDAIGASHSNGYSWDKMLDRIADLIEPPLQCPYYDSRKHWCSIYDVPTIGRDALLVLADEIDRKSNDGTVNPDPMKPIASSLDLFGYARRIREAVGA